jgi:hypothetical protein
VELAQREQGLRVVGRLLGAQLEHLLGSLRVSLRGVEARNRGEKRLVVRIVLACGQELPFGLLHVAPVHVEARHDDAGLRPPLLVFRSRDRALQLLQRVVHAALSLQEEGVEDPVRDRVVDLDDPPVRGLRGLEVPLELHSAGLQAQRGGLVRIDLQRAIDVGHEALGIALEAAQRASEQERLDVVGGRLEHDLDLLEGLRDAPEEALDLGQPQPILDVVGLEPYGLLELPAGLGELAQIPERVAHLVVGVRIVRVQVEDALLLRLTRQQEGQPAEDPDRRHPPRHAHVSVASSPVVAGQPRSRSTPLRWAEASRTDAVRSPVGWHPVDGPSDRAPGA